MVAKNLSRIVFGILTLVAALALPTFATAQINGVPIEFVREGQPGVTSTPMTNPLEPDGPPINVDVPHGAFVNPCTLEYVDVYGSSWITSSTTVDNRGFMRVTVGVVTKGNGFGNLDSVAGVYVAGARTGSLYSFTESQSFSFRIPTATLTTEEFTSDFTDKIAMKGARSIDNWMIRAHFKVKVNAVGEVTVLMIRQDADGTCKG